MSADTYDWHTESIQFDDSIAYYPAENEWHLLCSIDGCTNKAATTCHGDCMRAICAEHAAGRACCGGVVCVECNGGENNGNA